MIDKINEQGRISTVAIISYNKFNLKNYIWN